MEHENAKVAVEAAAATHRLEEEQLRAESAAFVPIPAPIQGAVPRRLHFVSILSPDGTLELVYNCFRIKMSTA